MPHAICDLSSARRILGGRMTLAHLITLSMALAAPVRLCADAAPQELLGRWRSVETTKGGIGAMLFFRADGNMDFSLGAVVEVPYRIEGGEIVFPPATTGGPEQRTKLDFSGQDQLRIGSDQLARKGSAPDPKLPVLGEWEGKRDMGGSQVQVHYIFNPDAKCLLLIPFTTTTCHYAIEGRNIRVELPNQQPELRDFQLENGLLHFSYANETRDYVRY